MKKRILPIFMTLLLAITMVPTPVLADDVLPEEEQVEMLEMMEEEIIEEVFWEEDASEDFEEELSLEEESEEGNELELFADNEIWDGTVATSFAGGSGTEDDPYLIENGAQLALVIKRNPGYFRLVEDIYLNDTNNWKSWTAEKGPDNIWTPLDYFTGSLDGDGHTIYGLYTDATKSYQGLFGRSQDNGKVKNLTIAESHVFGTDHVASFVAKNSGIIWNCKNEGDVTATGDYAAGIASTVRNENAIEDCVNYGNVTALGHAGGIVGYSNSEDIKNCKNYGTISSTDSTGGIIASVGGNGIASVEGCSNYGKVFNTAVDFEDVNQRTGGIAGSFGGKQLKNCSNHAEVTGYDNVGGIIGSMDEMSEVDGCTNYGNVIAYAHPDNEEAGEEAGGIVGGGEGVIQNCTNHADIEGYRMVGGIAGGMSEENSQIKGCINYGKISSLTNNTTDETGVNVGGIAGVVYDPEIYVEDCVNYGDVSGVERVGGLFGSLFGCPTKVKSCVNEGSVTAETGCAGGITGILHAWGDGDSLIELCVNKGTVNGGTSKESYATGGIAGYTPVESGDSVVIRNCYNTGSVRGYECVGGIVAELRVLSEGSSAQVENCYSICTVSGTTTVSGTVALVGTKAANTSVTVKNCYGLDTTSAEVHKYGDANNLTITNVKALSKTEMGNQSSFEGFDFATVWFIAGDGSYPVFRGNAEEGEMDNVLTYAYYENSAVIVTAEESNENIIYAMVVSYEEGKMAAMDIVELEAGAEGTLTLKDWGQKVKLFVISDKFEPVCPEEKL